MVTKPIGIAIHLRYGRHLPHLVLVLSTIEPIIGSLRASYILVKSIRSATAVAPVVLPILASAIKSASVINMVRYEPMMVQIKFWPIPVILYAIASRGCILPSFGVVPNSLCQKPFLTD